MWCSSPKYFHFSFLIWACLLSTPFVDLFSFIFPLLWALILKENIIAIFEPTEDCSFWRTYYLMCIHIFFSCLLCRYIFSTSAAEPCPKANETFFFISSMDFMFVSSQLLSSGVEKRQSITWVCLSNCHQFFYIVCFGGINGTHIPLMSHI